MQEYGMYIWPCYFGLLIVCLWNVINAFQKRKHVLRKLSTLESDNATQSQT